MTEKLMHEPKVVVDDDAEVYFVECALCGKVLWHPDENDVCNPPPPTLGINITEGLGTKDIFGG